MNIMETDLILSQAMMLLRETDVRITGGSLDALSLTLPDRSVREVKVQLASTPPTPSKLQAILEREVRRLIVTIRPTERLTEAALQDEVELITIAPASVIIGGVQRLERRHTPETPKRPRGRAPWGRWALMRALALADGPQNQKELAAATRISQPAVNKHLKTLESFVDRDQWGWHAHDVDAIVASLLDNYPGPRGVTSYWYGLDSTAEQAKKAAEFASELGASPLVSGDAAADIYAPWRLPDSAIVYLLEAVDFTDAGFAPSTPEEATLVTAVPEDFTLWATAALVHRPEGIPLADPLIVLRDVTAGDAVDSHEAADHLRKVILTKAVR
ncbi:ArsR family transcriptional regulator [Paenarthrobacter sp. NPDC089989]|uniref:ArsR family transcriptional regulator n=1 Tax=unclassified Paenarthrobacter TaxID=2634190 RepID=UPI00380F5513